MRCALRDCVTSERELLGFCFKVATNYIVSYHARCRKESVRQKNILRVEKHETMLARPFETHPHNFKWGKMLSINGTQSVVVCVKLKRGTIPFKYGERSIWIDVLLDLAAPFYYPLCSYDGVT